MKGAGFGGFTADFGGFEEGFDRFGDVFGGLAIVWLKVQNVGQMARRTGDADEDEDRVKSKEDGERRWDRNDVGVYILRHV